MKFQIILLFLLPLSFPGIAQETTVHQLQPGYEIRIRNYVDSLEVIDTHEHLFTPEIIKGSYFLDFMLLFQQSGYDDLKSAGLPDSLFSRLFNEPLTPAQKWILIEPYWKNTFNTSFNRVILKGVKNLYSIDNLSLKTVGPLSDKMKKAYSTSWFDKIIRDSCHIKYVIQDGYYMPGKDDYFRYVRRFDSWLTVKSKYRIDSLAILQLDPIFTLEEFVNSMRLSFENEVKKGMVAVKIFIAYSRTLSSEKVETEAARKVFKSLVNGDEDHVISEKDAKPLQDYMLYRLLDLAREHSLPVAFHTGLQAGRGNIIGNSDPTLLTSLINAYPDVNFILYHGGYPYGGELSALAKNYKNVYIDMNWLYSLSPSYIERYLNEWLETVPVSRLMAFGGDLMVVENVYAELKIARKIISDVLCSKVKDGYMSEDESKIVARKILFDNAAKVYKLQ